MGAIRTCTLCGAKAFTEEDLDNFQNGPQSKYGKVNRCNDCGRKAASISSLAGKIGGTNELGRRNTRAKLRYGIDYFTFKDRKDAVDSCECCGTILITDQDKHYDHVHNPTKDFRGILCRTCNTGIGMLGDDLPSVLNAVKYLTRSFYKVQD